MNDRFCRLMTACPPPPFTNQHGCHLSLIIAFTGGHLPPRTPHAGQSRLVKYRLAANERLDIAHPRPVVPVRHDRRARDPLDFALRARSKVNIRARNAPSHTNGDCSTGTKAAARVCMAIGRHLHVV
jgi:hypothetical protein